MPSTKSTLTNRLADVLVEHVTDPEVTDTLFSKVSHQRAVRLKTELPLHRALLHCKGGIVQATTIAQSATDPAVLDKYARDPRKTVRRAVAANSNLAPKTAAYLHKWAIQKADYDSLASVLPRVPIDESLPLAGSGFRYPWTALARAFARDGSREGYLKAKESGHEDLVALLAPSVHDRKIAGLTLTEFLDGLPQETRRAALNRVASSTRVLTSEAVDLAMQVGGETSFFMVQEVESDEVVRTILKQDNEDLLVSLARCRVSAQVVHKLLDRGSPAVAEQLSLQIQRKLTTAMAEKAIPLLIKGSVSPESAERFLTKVTAPLESSLVLDMLRCGNISTTRRWVSGLLPSAPRPGDVQALLEKPGLAFAENAYYRRIHHANPTMGYMARQLSPAYGDALNKPWGRELVDGLGVAFLEEACTNSDAAAYITRVMMATMKDRPALWEVALELAPEWSGGLTGLLEMAYLTQGEVPPASITAATTPAPVKRTKETGQLFIPGL